MRRFELRRLLELDYICGEEDGGLGIDALTKISALAESPVVVERFTFLHAAAMSVASPLLRNLGTLGGNLCLDTRCVYCN